MQGISEQVSRNWGLRHLEGNIAPMAHDLDKPVPERRQRPMPDGVLNKLAAGLSATIEASPSTLQPGNSGGPIYDQKGNPIGVVVSKLSKVKFAKLVGSIP